MKTPSNRVLLPIALVAVGVVLLCGFCYRYGWFGVGDAQKDILPVSVVTSQVVTKTTVYQVNINTADIYELQCLPGVGKERAQRIIEYREETGGFQSIEELLQVSGIGQITYQKLVPYITI